MRVEFSELAEAALRKLFDEGRRASYRASLAFYLREKHEEHSERCPAFSDIELFVYPLGPKWRVLYERNPSRVLVWSITEKSAEED